MDQQEKTRKFYADVWPHAAAVLRSAQFLTRDPAEADDLAQDVMLKAFRHLDQFRAGTDMKSWLLTILRNTRIDRARTATAQKQNVSLEQLGSEPVAPPESSDDELWNDPKSVLQQFSDKQIIQALHALPEEIRWTLMLVDVEGMDHALAAQVLDVPVGTIKSRAHRGRAMLRTALAPLARGLRIIP